MNKKTIYQSDKALLNVNLQCTVNTLLFSQEPFTIFPKRRPKKLMKKMTKESRV